MSPSSVNDFPLYLNSTTIPATTSAPAHSQSTLNQAVRSRAQAEPTIDNPRAQRHHPFRKWRCGAFCNVGGDLVAAAAAALAYCVFDLCVASAFRADVQRPA